MLTAQQINQFRANGYAIIENALNKETIDSINQQIDVWTHLSRKHTSNFGQLINGEPRFDLEPGHSETSPKLRRVASPIEISPIIKDVLTKECIPEIMTPLLGEDIKFDHCKVNAKYPGMKADVKYHQDHIFEPQTNDTMLTCLIMLDDSTIENGCLKIVPGSHRKRYNHCDANGHFIGRIDDKKTQQFDQKAHNIVAKSGSICLMDTWAVHGSGVNQSSTSRRILISEYKSADAYPLTKHKLPSRYMDATIRGVEPNFARHRIRQDFKIPTSYDGDSLFDLQDMVENNNTVYAEAV